ncbi:hypothetical protein [Sphingopyxis sp. RIFCSPHIGHO2_12_FULL_65_19]|uniref:hypothetical protein n=1 Tax=Sphingopyxis sp. RIFCSPHIGHO2_12_FULL_65_19 TaxID=1802172 RepID=UPI0025ECA391|nr:hypothetical protein [Sphingopyxis sp. RIFCSPHIGHO2_12_FULL_65_19]
MIYGIAVAKSAVDPRVLPRAVPNQKTTSTVLRRALACLALFIAAAIPHSS